MCNHTNNSEYEEMQVKHNKNILLCLTCISSYSLLFVCPDGLLFPGVKQPGREADHSVPPSVQVRNEWSCTATPTTCLEGVAGNNFLLPSGPQQARVLTII